MSELKQKSRSNGYVITFMVILSFVCATVLSVLASALQKPQEIAKELDRSKQMLIAARIISPFGYFQVQNQEGDYVPAKEVGKGELVQTDEKIYATEDQILAVYRRRIHPMLVNNQGQTTTFQKAGVNEQEYIQEFRKTGYYREPLKLIYQISPNPSPNQKKTDEAVGYVIPVNGYGLWDAIYGYIAIAPDGDRVIGISWYDQKETPGLGANITTPEWQSQFHGKEIFQESREGTTDFATAPIGITVVKGKVSDVYGNSPKAKSAVDGMAGATLTGSGVTNAYRDVLSAYRSFFEKIHGQYKKEEKTA